MKRLLLLLLCGQWCAGLMAQQDGVVLHGSIQSDVLVAENDSAIGAEKTDDVLTNTYVSLQLDSRYVEAGARLEYLEHPLPGYEKDFEGWGVPHYYVKGKLKHANLTAGTFYEQFGSGFILRSYEDRMLGIDNALLGGRLVATPTDGLTVKVLSGRQRRYWTINKAQVTGVDAEVSVDEWIHALQNHDTRLMVGMSWVNRYEKSDQQILADETHIVNFPHNVYAWDFRVNLNHGPWDLLAEYAQKTDDPSHANGFIFRQGTAVLLSGSYSKKGMSVQLQAKRSEDMSFKSTTDPIKAMGSSSAINHLPAFTEDHTYHLAAFYPYQTQLADGEWAYQAEVGYTFKRQTLLGGKYGTTLKLNLSYVRAIDRDFVGSEPVTTLAGTKTLAGTDGYRSSFFKWGDETYYQDFNVQLTKKLSKEFKLLLMYLNQRYNQAVVEGHGDMLRCNTFIADGKYQFSPKTTLRGELQYLTTAQDDGDWAFGLFELSLAPHWMLTVSDLYNVGATKLHYYQGLVTFSTGAHRLQAGYGRTEAGLSCAGGVCRYLPAIKGLSLSYNYNF